VRVIHICLGTNAHLRMLISRHTTIPMLTKYLAMNFKETSQMTLSCTNNFFFFARKFLPEVFNEWMLLDQPATWVPLLCGGSSPMWFGKDRVMKCSVL
jgi:hypothetical protein